MTLRLTPVIYLLAAMLALTSDKPWLVQLAVVVLWLYTAVMLLGVVVINHDTEAMLRVACRISADDLDQPHAITRVAMNLGFIALAGAAATAGSAPVLAWALMTLLAATHITNIRARNLLRQWIRDKAAERAVEALDAAAAAQVDAMPRHPV